MTKTAGRLLAAAVLVLLLSLLGGGLDVRAADIASGTSGSCDWSIDGDGLLTISPSSGSTGTLDTWSTYTSAPWYDYASDIETAEITGTVYAQTCVGFFAQCTNLTTITGLTNLDTSNVTSMYYMFYNCQSLTSADVSGFNTSSVTKMEGVFYNCYLLEVIDVSDWDTSNVTSFQRTFYNCRVVTELSVAGWVTSKATTMYQMFCNCYKITALDLSGWDTANVTSMQDLFYGCSGLTSLDLSGFDTSKVTTMYRMFYGCSGLTSLDLSGFDTSKVTTMYQMFYGCSGLTALDLSNFDITKLTNISFMFQNCSGLTAIPDGVSSWLAEETKSSITAISGIFAGCTGIDVDTILGVLGDWDLSGITDLSYMFRDLTGLTEVPEVVGEWLANGNNVTTVAGMFYGCTGLKEVDASGWDLSGVTTLAYLFHSCSSLTKVDASGWDTSGVTSLYQMFYGCTQLVTIEGMDGWETSNVTTMQQTFQSCSALTSLNDVEGWDTSSCTTFYLLFWSCKAMTSLDLSGWDTAKVKDMEGMFGSCSGLTSLDVSRFDTSTVTCMYRMFQSCSGLTSLDVSSFNTSSVTRMECMFQSCSGLTSLDVSNFDTSNVGNTSHTATSNYYSMYYMFGSCSGLTSLDVSNFDTSNVTNMAGMFYSCTKLESITGLEKFNTSNVVTMSQMFMNCQNLTSLEEIDEWDTSACTTFYRLFYQCYKLEDLDLTEWETSNVTNMEGVFYACYALDTSTLSALTVWDTSSVTTMRLMFCYCTGLTELNLSGWNTSNVTTMQSMFYGCTGLTELNLSGWNTSNVTTMQEMFRNCSSLTALNLAGFTTSVYTETEVTTEATDEEGNITTSTTKEVDAGTNMHCMFYNCKQLVELTLGPGFRFNSSYVSSNTVYNSSNYYPYTPATASINDGNDYTGYWTIYHHYYHYGYTGLGTGAESGAANTSSWLASLYNSGAVTTTITWYAEIEGTDTEMTQSYTSIKDNVYDPTGALYLDENGSIKEGYENYFEKDEDGNYVKDSDGNYVLKSAEDIFRSDVLEDQGNVNQGYWQQIDEDTWVYTFYVYNSEVSWYVTEDAYGNYITTYEGDDIEGETTATTIEDQYAYVAEAEEGETATVAVITNSLENGALSLSKSVVEAVADESGNATGETEDVSDATVFTFTIVLTDSSGNALSGNAVYDYTITQTTTVSADTDSDGSDTSSDNDADTGTAGTTTATEIMETGSLLFQDGKATVTLGDDQTLTIEGLWAGYQYSVTEAEVTGYTLASGSNQTQIGTISAGTTSTASWTNVRAADYEEVYAEQFVDVTITKTVTGSYESLEGESFSFEVVLNGLTAGTTYTYVISSGTDTTDSETDTADSETDTTNNTDTTSNTDTGDGGTDAADDGTDTADSGTDTSTGTAYTFTAGSSGIAYLTFELADGESAVLYSLPVGAQYSVTEAAGDYTASYEITDGNTDEDQTAQIVTSAVGNTGENAALATSLETADEGEEITIAFTNKIVRTGDVTIAKVVQTASGSEDEDDTETEYTFTVTLTGLDPDTSLTTSVGTLKADDDGTASVSYVLRGGKSVTLYDLPVGATYQITEAASVSIASYTVVDANAEDTSSDTAVSGTIASASGSNDAAYTALSTAVETVDEGEDVTVTFTNKKVGYAKVQIWKYRSSTMLVTDLIGPARYLLYKSNDTFESALSDGTKELTIETVKANCDQITAADIEEDVGIEVAESGKSEAVGQLETGKYYIFEVEAPEGYALTDAVLSFTIETSDLDSVVTVKVTDEELNILYNSGGIGSYALIGASALACLAAVWYALRRRGTRPGAAA